MAAALGFLITQNAVCSRGCIGEGCKEKKLNHGMLTDGLRGCLITITRTGLLKPLAT